MKLNKCMNVRRMGGLFAILFAMAMVLNSTAPVMAQGANAPTLNVGDSAYFGGIVDIGKEYKDEMNEALKDFEDMGFDVNLDVNGGAGAYFGWEVASNTANINDYTCYDIALMGAVGIDLGIDAKVKGSMSEYGMTVSVDAKGKAVIQGEAVLEGHLFLTVDELAVAKLQLKLTVEAEASLSMDATANYAGTNMKAKVDATAEVKNVEFNLVVMFDPPIDLYDFPINQGDTWYVPAQDTEVTGSASASGTIKYDVEATITGEEPVKESETMNLATEIGTKTIAETIPGGAPEYYYGWSMGGGTLFKCTSVIGNVVIIEMDVFGMMEDMPFPGTRQFDSFMDPESMMPSMGMQIDTSKGMMTGIAMDGAVMTETATKAEVEAFIESPQATVAAETGGAGGSGGLMLLLVIVVLLVAVVLVVVMMSRKKKTPPPQQYPAPEQQMYGPQPGYEQPPAQSSTATTHPPRHHLASK